jgi:hypothetical protein
VTTRALLVAEITALFARARWTLWRADLPRALQAVRRPRGALAAGVSDPRRLARAVARTLPLLPGETRCLMRSLVLSGLLARRGLDSRLLIGVSPGDSFGAHAWVELDGRPLLPPGGSRFQRLVEL